MQEVADFGRLAMGPHNDLLLKARAHFRLFTRGQFDLDPRRRQFRGFAVAGRRDIFDLQVSGRRGQVLAPPGSAIIHLERHPDDQQF